MPKRDKKTITIGSALPYCMPYVDTVPSVEEICKDEYLLGYIKSGAAVEYSEEAHEEKDDLGRVSKIVTINEEALVKMGLITWNGTTLQQLIDRCKVTEEAGKRITKIGGAGNAQGKYYVLCLHHIDPVDGDLWVLIVGRNTAGATLTLAADEGTLIEPEFKAMPQDEDGTLIQLIEALPAA
jgi:hypothetical protein